MTGRPHPAAEPSPPGDPTRDQPPTPDPSGVERLWRPDTAADAATGGHPPAARRVRMGCWALVVVLLLICCVLGAWLTDAVLDLRALTTGG